MSDETDIASFDLTQIEDLTKSRDQLQPDQLTPLSPEVIGRQATINIGTIGHVAHGKSTLVKALSGVQTVRFKNELERNITIKLGYANAKIYQCDSCPSDRPGRYCSQGSKHPNSFPCPNQGCDGGIMRLQRHISFVDCFGKDTQVLMFDRSIKSIDQITVDDLLMGDDLTPRRVLNIKTGRKPLYRITYVTRLVGRFKEKFSFTCTGGHLLVLKICTPAKIKVNELGDYIVEHCRSTQDGHQIMFLENTFPNKQSALDFYQTVITPIIYEITVEAFLVLPKVIQQLSCLYRVNLESNQTIITSAYSFTINEDQIGEDEFVGLETDGNQRFLLSDGLVVHNCPGHDILMATMLNGAAVMDGALLLIAGNEKCPQPQTREHLAAVEIMQLRDIILVQNKLDLVGRERAEKQYQEIKEFTRHTVAENSPLVPISAQLKNNVDVVCEYICTQIPIPVRDFSSPPRMMIVRSFDINKPGTKYHNLKGGVAGGTLICGMLKVGQTVEIRPGIIIKDPKSGDQTCRPLITEITSLFSEGNVLDYAVPGGLIGVGTKLDPNLCRADRLIGQVLGAVGTLPEVYHKLEIEYQLLDRVIGIENESQVSDLKKGEGLMINVGSVSVSCTIISVDLSKRLIKLNLTSPVCTSEREKVAISRNVDQHWRLIGWGIINRGRSINVAVEK